METKVNVQGGTIQLPDGTTGYFKSEYVENCSDIKYSDKGVVKYDIKLDKTDGRCLVFHNNDLNKDFIVPLSDQIEKYEKTYIAQIVNPLVIENNSCSTIITFSVNSETKLTKYEPSKLYKMTKEQSQNCSSTANQATVFSALLKIEKLDKNIIPICVAIKVQSKTLDAFVNDIGGGGGDSVLCKITGGSSGSYSVTIYGYDKNSEPKGNGTLFVPDIALGAQIPSGTWIIGHKMLIKITGGNEK